MVLRRQSIISTSGFSKKSAESPISQGIPGLCQGQGQLVGAGFGAHENGNIGSLERRTVVELSFVQQVRDFIGNVAVFGGEIIVRFVATALVRWAKGNGYRRLFHAVGDVFAIDKIVFRNIADGLPTVPGKGRRKCGWCSRSPGGRNGSCST